MIFFIEHSYRKVFSNHTVLLGLLGPLQVAPQLPLCAVALSDVTILFGLDSYQAPS